MSFGSPPGELETCGVHANAVAQRAPAPGGALKVFKRRPGRDLHLTLPARDAWRSGRAGVPSNGVLQPVFPTQ